MEIQIPYSIFFTFFCFLFLIQKLSSNFKKPNKPLPPGPWKLPLIGNLHQLAGSLPHHALRDLAIKHGPLMRLQLGELPHVIVTSPELAKEVMKTHDIIFANRPTIIASNIIAYNSTDIVFSPYGNRWRQLRKICTLELLSAKRVKSFRTIREEEISLLVKNTSEHVGSAMNVSRKLFTLTNSIVIRAAFGKKQSENMEGFVATVQQGIRLGSGLSIGDLYPSVKILGMITRMKATVEKVHREIDRLLESIIKDHMEKKGMLSQITEAEEDLVDVLLRVRKENDLEISLSLDNIKAVLMDILLGGTETSATTIEWAMSELLRHPEAMKEAQAEVRRVYGGKGYVDETDIEQLKYVGAVIKETLRMHPPVPLLVPRENSETCEINGYEIPRKTKVIINAWAMGRDPKYWNEPHKFEPQRFLNNSISYTDSNFEYIPFGAGRRICPGISFAIVVVELLLANLLYHYDWMLPSGMKPHELEMNESFGATVRRKNDLWVVPINYPP